MLKDILQWILIVVLAAFCGFLYLHKTPDGTGRDGNPIGFDLKTINQTPLVLSGDTANKCFSSGKQQCFVQIRYLSASPVPTCVPNATYDCNSDPKPRTLPDCSDSSGELCITVTANALAQHQDDDGVHYPLSTATGHYSETRIIISPSAIPNR